MVLHIFLSIITSTFVLLLYLSSGLNIVHYLKIKVSPSLTFLLSYAFGFALSALGLFILTASSLVNRETILLFYICLCVFAIQSLEKTFSLLKYLIVRARSFFFHQSRVLQIVLTILLITYTIRGLLPPTGFDSLMYHLSTIKLYLLKGGFWDIYFNPQSDFPMLCQFNFMPGIAWGNDIICKTISLQQGFYSLGLIGVLGSTIFSLSRRDILLSMLFFLTFTNTIPNLATCYIDIPNANWMVLSTFFAIQYTKNSDKKLLFASGLLAGMALSSKIFSICLLPILTIITYSHKNEYLLPKTKNLFGLVLLPALALAMPWYVKSYLFSGTVFGSPSLSLHGVLTENVFSFSSFLKNVIYIVTSPWHYSIYPSLHRGDTLSPLFFMTIPFIAFLSINKKQKLFFKAILLWLLQLVLLESIFLKEGASIRYSTYITIIAAPYTLFIIARLHFSPFVKRTYMATVIVSILLGSLLLLKRYRGDWYHFFSLSSKKTYYEQTLPEYKAISFINSLEDSCAVMPVYNFSNYLLEKKYITAYRQYNSVRLMIDDLKDKRVGYFFGNNSLDTSENRVVFPEIDGQKKIFSSSGFTVFALPDSICDHNTIVGNR